MHRAVVMGVAAALLAGCSDVGPTDPYTARSGTYVLRSINGTDLPATISETAEGTITVTTGGLTLRADRTFSEVWTARLTPSTGEPVNGTLTEEGTYEITGDAIVFDLPARPGRGAATVEGTFSGDTLTYTFSGRTIVYVD